MSSPFVWESAERKLPTRLCPIVTIGEYNIDTKGIFTLSIKAVLVWKNGEVLRGFMPSLKACCLDAEDGVVVLGENETAYNSAKELGRLWRDEKIHGVSNPVIPVI
jgi:hypothetical protein